MDSSQLQCAARAGRHIRRPAVRSIGARVGDSVALSRPAEAVEDRRGKANFREAKYGQISRQRWRRIRSGHIYLLLLRNFGLRGPALLAAQPAGKLVTQERGEHGPLQKVRRVRALLSHRPQPLRAGLPVRERVLRVQPAHLADRGVHAVEAHLQQIGARQ